MGLWAKKNVVNKVLPRVNKGFLFAFTFIKKSFILCWEKQIKEKLGTGDLII